MTLDTVFVENYYFVTVVFMWLLQKRNQTKDSFH